MKITPTTYLHSFAFATVFLALVRCGMEHKKYEADLLGIDTAEVDSTDTVATAQIEPVDTTTEMGERDTSQVAYEPSKIAEIRQNFHAHPIYSVPSYKEAFPDTNDIHMTAAKRYGVKPVQNRLDAEKRKSEVVYIGASPYFAVDNMRESIPYLVPRASVLLQDIGQAFYDSLYVKGLPFQQFIVTSALRTEDDVAHLRTHNRNASENSCHRFGTTFDICYNRYKAVQTAEKPQREVQSDTLKWVLSEVLRDMRERGRCFVKYEVRQGCFHVTTR